MEYTKELLEHVLSYSKDLNNNTVLNENGVYTIKVDNYNLKTGETGYNYYLKIKKKILNK